VGTFVFLFRTKEWRSFYPWGLIAAYSVATGIVTAFGRVSFGVQQATESRYTVFSLFFYLALVGGTFAFYFARIQKGSPAGRACFLTNAAWLCALAAFCWVGCYQKNLPLLSLHREHRVKLLDALKWMEVIPDNPDLALVYPSIEVLRRRARTLSEHGILRVPFIKGPLAARVWQSPADASGSAGRIETCAFDSRGSLLITGWAWLRGRNQRADYVVIGCKDTAGNFKPISVFNPGVPR
jgi:hypothetical protein